MIKISQVQRNALNSLMETYGADYRNMVEQALGEYKDIEDLSYVDAILVVKKGNDLYRPPRY